MKHFFVHISARTLRIAAFLGISLVLATSLQRPLWAQSDTGALFGSITDTTGAVVPGAFRFCDEYRHGEVRRPSLQTAQGTILTNQFRPATTRYPSSSRDSRDCRR